MVLVKIPVLYKVSEWLPKSDVRDNVKGVVLGDFAKIVENTRTVSGR